MRRFKKLLALIFILNANTLVAQQIKYEQPIFTDKDRLQKIQAAMPVIDNLFKAHAEKNHFPSFVWGLVVDGKLIHTGNTGYSNIDKKIAASTNTNFRIASMTKSFTSMCILKLRDEGKLRLDDPVYLYIPGMKNQHYPTADAAPVTVRNLLTHSAGFPEDNPWGDRQLAVSDKQLLDLIAKGISYSNDPSQAYEYSNLGFAMLGYIVKKVSGKPYTQYLTENILKPLGMNNTFMDHTKIEADRLAHGYRWLNEKWVEQPMLADGAYGPMGGMITTMEDFSKYVSLFLSAWPPNDNKESGPVKRSSIREIQQPWNISSMNANFKYPSGRACPLVTAYGYGFNWYKDCEGRIMGAHSGGLPGFGSNWRILQEYGIGIIAFANLTYASTSGINLQALDTLITLADLKPRQLVASSILNQRKNELIKILPDWKNAAASGIFADNFFLDYFPDALQKEATAIFNKAGKITRVRELIPENGLRGSFIMEGGNSNIEVSFTLTPENPALIQEYHIGERKK
jgi:CubicO group peptidase (beta-lactamase class C family)